METRDLADRLMRADKCEEVVDLLMEIGYWQDEKLWRYLGDSETNFSAIGNQQSDPVSSVVEKIINGVDARLMNVCIERNIEPESDEAPATMRAAVAKFFEEGSNPETDGLIRYWSDPKIRSESRFITVAATGNKPVDGSPCISIADQGEGQTPDSFSDTFMSLQKGNKNRILFVQGKYNMGGTGALSFCASPHRLQLIISRRNPQLLADNPSDRDNKWGITVVRSEKPVGNEKNSKFTYLAPISATNRNGKVLAFASDVWPIFPNQTGAYAVDSSYGTLIKLYEYDLQNKSNIVSSESGLFRRLDQGMPELMLPVRVYECRSGYQGTLEGALIGLIARLEKDRANTLELGFPEYSEIRIKGQRIPLRIYAFKAGHGQHYRTQSSSVLLTLNGQTHAALSSNFFRRKSVKLSYLADSLLIVVDCSKLRRDLQEELFMASRDRLRKSTYSIALERELESLLQSNTALRELQNRRRQEHIGAQLTDDKPLKDLLEIVLKRNPKLAQLLEKGKSISSPFGSGAKAKVNFEGKRFPTFFHFKQVNEGDILERKAELGRKIRLEFITDASNDYFGRDIDPGRMAVEVNNQVPTYALSAILRGNCSLYLEIPKHYKEGDIIEVMVLVEDVTQIRPFANCAKIELIKRTSSGSVSPPQSKGSVLSLPNIVKVSQRDWNKYGFDSETALAIKYGGDASMSNLGSGYDFFVNIDNIYLRDEQKNSKNDAKILEQKFTYSLVLISMALLRDPKAFKSLFPEEDQDIEELVKLVSRSIARVLLPVMNSVYESLNEDVAGG